MIVASIHGRCAKDVIIGETKAGKTMARTTLAVDASGFRAEEQETLWITLFAFGKQADLLEKVQKGEMVSAFGRMSRSHFTGKEGEQRESWSLAADSLVTARSARPPGRKAAPRSSAGVDFDDEISF